MFELLLHAHAEKALSRLGTYRIVFEVDLLEQTVFILAIGPRGDIYKK